ncbi:hypothetical protein Tsubulata_002831 [Turnera subulata]|uniref:BHLH domain-containing protein n=1 Tax=Turnera subulata TaxID=218843 RepID=A0A9Q0EYT4_9ROSI|nr:hypothetical protein Tsubulata_002831 [Turnera subulata]
MGLGTDLHNTLRSLCLNTQWKYAVFWKLKHRARMVLTWEDAYCDNSEQYDPSGSKYFGESQENLLGGHYSGDQLGLAVAKMSYHVYSLGEGIVGQVAVSGKHQWIFADEHATNSFSSFEFSDGWQSQFLAGIKTIVVVAVVPYGVVQLGSMSKVVEDVKLVTRIRDVFFTLQDSTIGHVTGQLQCNTMGSLCLPDLPAKDLASEVGPNGFCNQDITAIKGVPKDWMPVFPYLLEHSHNPHIASVPVIPQKSGFELSKKRESPEQSAPKEHERSKLLQLKSNLPYSDHQNQLGIDDHMYGGETSVWRNLHGASEPNVTLQTSNYLRANINPCNDILPVEKFEDDPANFPVDLIDSTVCNRVKSHGMDIYTNGVLDKPGVVDVKFKKELEKLELQANPIEFSTSDAYLKFSAGCELLEALGPAFMKRCMPLECNSDKAEAGDVPDMPEGMNSSEMTFDTGPENLLEAVVGNVCHSASDAKSEQSVCKSVQSLLTAEKLPEPSGEAKYVVRSTGYSINQSSIIEDDTPNCSNSTGVCGAMSSKGFSSTYPSTCSDQLDKRSEPVKSNKKRARPGENCRPRPRDRQLIQDRIKELRELVPNGSKCSIDSLLERTIKHMLFLESVTKHADKLNKCAESKMHQKGADTSSYEQGSSWAVEVGGHLKVSSIIVENLNKSGQMLVEMLCEECSHFLEIAEAIRTLGMTILKGITEAHGEKTWICFVVEGQNNRVLHRMDVLWSLVQILQPKATN